MFSQPNPIHFDLNKCSGEIPADIVRNQSHPPVFELVPVPDIFET
jgi:hypothetical protein